MLFCSALQLLKFQKNVKTENSPQAGYPLNNQPDLKMHFKYVEKTVRHGPTKHYTHPRTDVSYVGICYYSVLASLLLSSQAVLIAYLCFFRVTLQPCCCEVDVSIVDRITALLNPQPLCRRNTKFASGHMRDVRICVIQGNINYIYAFKNLFWEMQCTMVKYEVCSRSIRIGIVVVVHWVGCVCNQSLYVRTCLGNS